jgi:hypothetical protein
LIRWNDETKDLILQTTRQLQAEGMTHPSIRAVLYRLLDYAGWSKKHYNTLCRRLGKWRDQGTVPYGMFTDDGGGARDRPYTANEIDEQLKVWSNATPARLPADGYLHALLVEHQSLVSQIEEWCDGQALVVSSAGQLRRENLWHAVQDWKRMRKEMHAKGIVVYGLLDYDKGGGYIANAHSKWFKDIAGLPFVKWGLTPEQLDFLGLPRDEDAQIDGAFGRNPTWWKESVRKLLGLTATA